MADGMYVDFSAYIPYRMPFIPTNLDLGCLIVM